MACFKSMIARHRDIVNELHALVRERRANRDRSQLDLNRWKEAGTDFRFNVLRSKVAQLLDRADADEIERDPELREFVFDYISLDPIYFRSGYAKERLTKQVKRLSFTDDEKEILRQTILRRIQKGALREFRRYCQVIPKIKSDAFDQITRLALHEALFAKVNRQLHAHGLILRKGTLIDATIVRAAVKPPHKEGGAEPGRGLHQRARQAMTNKQVPPKRNELADSLSTQINRQVDVSKIRSVSDLSPGLSQSKIFRVTAQLIDGSRSFILKIPDWGNRSLLRHSDPLIQKRERLFLFSELSAALERPLRAPEVIGVEDRHGRTWIWMKDERCAFEVRWSLPEFPLAAARAAVALHATGLKNRSWIDSYDWLAAEPYRLFEEHREEARNNVEQIAADPNLCPWLPSEWLTPLENCLSSYETAIRQLRRYPAGLVHGDYHPGNIGFTSDHRVLLVDWCQVGLSALGSDVATLINLYSLFGGGGRRSAGFEAQLMRAYHDELLLVCPNIAVPYADIERVVWLWAMTWGLHLRLGPGMSFVIGGKINDTKILSSTISDIYDGCERVVEKVDRFLPKRIQPPKLR